MAGNSFGEVFRVTTFGESHGTGIGVVIDGCPSGMSIDIKFIQKELDKRKPGLSPIISERKELDKAKIISGVFEGKTLGTTICIMVENKDAISDDYNLIKDVFRPSHADFTYQQKYGLRDYRGGGRASARETIGRVIAGALAKLILQQEGISIFAYTEQIGKIHLQQDYKEINLEDIYSNNIRCPVSSVAEQMKEYVEEIKKEGDSIGGVVKCVITGCPAGLGEPVFDRLEADLGKAMLSIPACKGFEIGDGFNSATMKGSEHNDEFIKIKDGNIFTATNHSGGIQGGISNGMDIVFRVAFKPTPSIFKTQKTVNSQGDEVNITNLKGRFDACVVPRAVTVVEGMAAMVMAEHLLRTRIYNFKFQV